MSEKALRMLKHMRAQIRWLIPIQGTRAASVWGAARSIGLKPDQGQFNALLKELLRGDTLKLTQAPALPRTACTDLPIRAWPRLTRQIAPLRYGRVSGGRTEAVMEEGVREETWAPRPCSC